MARMLAVLALAALVVGVGCDSMKTKDPTKKEEEKKDGGYVMPAMSPYMYASDFADYKAGSWVTYTMSGTETTVKVIGKDGDNLWIETGMKASATEYAHLLLVQPDRKVVKAWYSGKDDKAWKKADITEMPKTDGKAGKECPGCKKEHKAPVMTESDGKVKAAGKEFDAHRIDSTSWMCDDKEYKSTIWYSKDVPQLYAMMKSEHGGLVAMDAAGARSMELTGLGTDAKPKHEVPK